MYLPPRSWLGVAVVSVVWLWAAVAAVKAQEATTSAPSNTTTQAATFAAQTFADFLKAEELATKHTSDVIEQTLTAFEWIIGIVGAILISGAGLFAWALRTGNIADKKQMLEELRTRVTETIDREIGTTLTRVAQRGKEAEQELSNQLDQARGKIAAAENALKEHGDIILDLVAFTVGQWPYNHLKAIYDKKTGLLPDKEFKFHEYPSSFKREIGFLIDNGYLQNINLDEFKDGDEMFDMLTITKAGEAYIRFRESRASMGALV
jgi:hypothetical protein